MIHNNNISKTQRAHRVVILKVENCPTASPPPQSAMATCFNEIRRMLREETFCDVRLVAAESTVSCHSIVLASALPSLSKILLATPGTDTNFTLVLPDTIAGSVVRQTVNDIYDALAGDEEGGKIGSKIWAHNLGLAPASVPDMVVLSEAQAQQLLKERLPHLQVVSCSAFIGIYFQMYFLRGLLPFTCFIFPQGFPH